jgi:hypothetical protein
VDGGKDLFWLQQRVFLAFLIAGVGVLLFGPLVSLERSPFLDWYDVTK